MKRTLYNKDHEAFRSVIRDFITKEVVPAFPEWEKAGQAPRWLFKRLGELGCLGFDVPEEYGGLGETSYKFQAIMTEEVARAAVWIGHHHISTGIVLPYLLRLANEEQKRRWLPGCANGDILLAIAMTEPGTGSDLANIRTTAKLSDDGTHYVLNGAKTFITGGFVSDLFVVAARTSPYDPDNRRHGLSLLVVDSTSEGFGRGRRLEKIGRHSMDTAELSFTDVRVPVENLLGEEGEGFTYLGQNLVRERLYIGVCGVAQARAAIRFATEYVKERQVFGKPVASFQNTKFVLAECEAETTAAEAMVDRGVELDDSGELTAADAAKIKLFCTEMSGRVIDKCLQLHGGYGYMLEYPIARLYTDTRVSRITGGTSEVQKSIIAKDLGL
ncbi:acyl-CoA dehydrogenase family protein [Streptomyces albipurpureus]|uniref:Acyl-[acyl-carrier-protein] dehydrogenase MbtN n=1 Tax=Streptomyces albipurpureus TaxID=2897419 RepID=A0ABT0UXW5_9ACTN|nr:acyl-CoA dehydrogenase family protein [Streptomyces sp. CWNU-1]MCM2393424.1 acyl-CoA dehydrogenase family protein [Streptomyces sp. CWNU-1]